MQVRDMPSSDTSIQIRAEGDSAPPYAIEASPGFADWLLAEDVALAVTTYQIGKVFLVGAEAPGRLAVTERTFARCLGVAVTGDDLYLAGRNAIYRFVNVVPRGQTFQSHDAVYAPQVAWYTGDVFAHDLGILPDRRPVFVNTLFSCLAVVDEETSFRSAWRPPFVSAMRPEDRCHLNGLAMDEATGTPRYLTAAAQTDTARGWREQRVGNGCVLELATDAVVCSGLTMPHSPRLHDGRLYVLNAGTGELGLVETGAARFQPLAFLPGFARGLALRGGCALVGLSLPRANQAFAGLPLDERLRAAGQEPRCAVIVVELASGRVLHELRLGGVVRELYDIALLPGARRPMLVGLGAGPIDRMIRRGPDVALASLLSSPAAPSPGS